MSSLAHRYIQIVIENQTYLIPTNSKVEDLENDFTIRFEFNRAAGPIDINHVTVFGGPEYARMITDRGNEFFKGGLYNQLLPWYIEMYEHWRNFRYI